MFTRPFDPLQVYRNREYACHMLSDQMFDALNSPELEASTVFLSSAGCLDAVDDIPAGSMRGLTLSKGWERMVIPTYVSRDDLARTPEQKARRDAAMRRAFSSRTKTTTEEQST